MIYPAQSFQRKPVVKVCGLTHQSDVDACVGMGVHYCGFIFHEASPRYIAPGRARFLRSAALKRVGVFLRHDEEGIIRIMEEARLDFAQLHGDQSIECAKSIGAHRVIRVLWPQRYESLAQLSDDMKRHADSCAMFLLDSGNSGGGSGQALDWERLHDLDAPRPWLLAGGLSGESIPAALANCTPSGLDLNSGIEWAPGHKSPASLLSALHVITQQQPFLHS